MPGQRKRRRSRERAHLRLADTPGRWEPLFSTDDRAELKAHVRHLRAEGTVTDLSRMRTDMACGRLVVPTTYRVSLFVPEATA